MKSIFKSRLRIFILLALLLVSFKGYIYRFSFQYLDVGNRSMIILTNKELISKVDSASEQVEINFESIVRIAREITVKELRFTIESASSDPNKSFITGYANCVGYSSMFNSILNYLIKKYELQNSITAKHKIGKLELFNFDVHQAFNSEFWKTHDYNEIRNLANGQVICVDPTLSDYLWINSVSQKE